MTNYNYILWLRISVMKNTLYFTWIGNNGYKVFDPKHAEQKYLVIRNPSDKPTHPSPQQLIAFMIVHNWFTPHNTHANNLNCIFRKQKSIAISNCLEPVVQNPQALSLVKNLAGFSRIFEDLHKYLIMISCYNRSWRILKRRSSRNC